jgi:hypothetical protein
MSPAGPQMLNRSVTARMGAPGGQQAPTSVGCDSSVTRVGRPHRVPAPENTVVGR